MRIRLICVFLSLFVIVGCEQDAIDCDEYFYFNILTLNELYSDIVEIKSMDKYQDFINKNKNQPIYNRLDRAVCSIEAEQSGNKERYINWYTISEASLRLESSEKMMEELSYDRWERYLRRDKEALEEFYQILGHSHVSE